MVVTRTASKSFLCHALVVGVVCLWASSACPAPISPSSWRPFTNRAALVTLGMNKGEVLIKAGRPDFDDIVSHGTDGFLTITVWTYIRTGWNAAVATLTFHGNTLVRIEFTLSKP